MFLRFRNVQLIVSVAAVVCLTVIICLTAISCSSELDLEISYYYVCYRISDNSISANSLSDTAESYGGAGYILCYENIYYVTIACYYSENDAQTVRSGLEKRDLNCSVLSVELDSFNLNGLNAKNNCELYKGNLNTLNSLSAIAYECANGLDDGTFNQSKAKDVVYTIKSTLNGLLKTNKNNCFTREIEYLVAQCDDLDSGYIYSKDMRYLQIAITDVVINIKLT